MKRIGLKEPFRSDRFPKTHAVVKRRGKSIGFELFCTRCQRVVKDANERCKGPTR